MHAQRDAQVHECTWGNHDAINGDFIVTSRFASVASVRNLHLSAFEYPEISLSVVSLFPFSFSLSFST
jgi:hypothetical protein